MKGSENRLKKYLFSIAGTRWDAQSHEDQFSSGIPDISFGANGINGWIELKQIEGWGGKNPVKPKKFTSTQVNWLVKRQRMGGHCFVMVLVQNEYYLFSAEQSRKIKDGMIRNEYIEESIAFWKPYVDPDDFIDAITNQSLSGL